MKKSFKYRLYPNLSQQILLEKMFNFCRFLYNCALEERISFYKKCKKSKSYVDQANCLPEIKNNFSLETENIHSQVLQQVLKQVDSAYKNFFRKIKLKSGKAGFPRFKNKDRFRSICFPQVKSDLSGTCVKFIDDSKSSMKKFKISGIGEVKVKYHRPIEGIAKQCRIVKQNDQYYIIISCDNVPNRTLSKTGKSCGIDLGIKNFICLDDGTKFHHPKPYKTSSEKLAYRQQKLAKMQRNSKNRRKQKSLIAKTHQKIFNIRNDWQHKVANQIVKDYDLIVIERLNVKGMMESKGFHQKSNITDASWGEFKNKLFYKAESAGKTIIEINPANTSKMCSHCGDIKKDLELADRTFNCESCGFEIDRDLNAAKNIFGLGQAMLTQKPSP